jgi:hypothetical protein
MPFVTDELLEYLQRLFPDAMPEPTISDRDLWIKRGEVGVVRHLTRLHKQQRENVLKDMDDVHRQ